MRLPEIRPHQRKHSARPEAVLTCGVVCTRVQQDDSTLRCGFEVSYHALHGTCSWITAASAVHDGSGKAFLCCCMGSALAGYHACSAHSMQRPLIGHADIIRYARIMQLNVHGTVQKCPAGPACTWTHLIIQAASLWLVVSVRLNLHACQGEELVVIGPGGLWEQYQLVGVMVRQKLATNP